MKTKRKIKKTYSQKIKSRARKTLSREISKIRKSYVIDTSMIVNRFLPGLVKKGLKGKVIVPNAVMAELENLANKGREEGFIGLEEVAGLHKLKQRGISVFFHGIRPEERHIKYAKSGEIDALIRDIAIKNKAVLITSDLVQAKSAQAYGLEVIFLRPAIKQIKKKKRFLFFKQK